jgi:predicted enzyme related to lactoylglutathione lyase
VHFEVVGKDGAKLQAFYRSAFGWEIDANNPMNYGLVKKEDGGIAGGVGPAMGGAGHVTFYVQVSDPKAALDKIGKLGGRTLMPPTQVTPTTTIAMFADPEGQVIGLVKGP